MAVLYQLYGVWTSCSEGFVFYKGQRRNRLKQQALHNVADIKGESALSTTCHCMMQLLRPNGKANAIRMAEGIKEVHAVIEPTLNHLLSSSTTARSWAESWTFYTKTDMTVFQCIPPLSQLAKLKLVAMSHRPSQLDSRGRPGPLGSPWPWPQVVPSPLGILHPASWMLMPSDWDYLMITTITVDDM